MLRKTCYFGFLAISFFISSNVHPLQAVTLSSEEKNITSVQSANRIIQAINYLPFSYGRDGCYARALYMGMELAVQRIPSQNLYIMGKLQPRGLEWKWHVAPAIKLASSEHAFVFDPSLSDTLVTGREWIRLANPKSDPKFHVAPVTDYKNKLAPSKIPDNDRDFSYYKKQLTIEFKNIPRFKISDIAHACQTAWHYIGLEKLTEKEKRKKRGKLLRRTSYLIDRLMKIGKINADRLTLSCPPGVARKLPEGERTKEQKTAARGR
jgi:hypothetical protein